MENTLALQARSNQVQHGPLSEYPVKAIRLGKWLGQACKTKNTQISKNEHFQTSKYVSEAYLFTDTLMSPAMSMLLSQLILRLKPMTFTSQESPESPDFNFTSTVLLETIMGKKSRVILMYILQIVYNAVRLTYDR